MFDPTPAETAPYDGVVKASVLRGFVTHLRDAGQLAAVRARVPDLTASLLDAPPPSTAWVSMDCADHVMAALAEVASPAAVREMVYECTRKTVAPVLLPILQGILRVFDTSPASLFARLDLVNRPMLRGARFTYEPSGRRAGVVELRFASRVAPAIAFTGWEGALRYIYDLCREPQGTVGPARVFEDGRAGQFTVSW